MAKRKFSKEVMLWAVDAVTNGELSISNCAKRLGCGVQAIRHWVNLHKAYGEDSFDDLNGHNHYSAEVRKKAVLDYLNGLGGLDSICIKHKISSNSVLRKWVLWYNDGVELDDYTPNKGIYHMKSRKTTQEEKIEIARFCTNNEFNYTLTAKQFAVPYSQVYQWVQKYKAGGDEALVDNRGKAKPIDELSEIELLRRELETIKRMLMLSNVENEILKKKEEIELRLLSQKHGKK